MCGNVMAVRGGGAKGLTCLHNNNSNISILLTGSPFLQHWFYLVKTLCTSAKEAKRHAKLQRAPLLATCYWLPVLLGTH
ncbi:unnamed protein product, partial [Ceratitis capitata]